jgi:pimeloyl-ACP methyl ester carboxylesterase
MTTATRAVYDGVDTRVLSVPGSGTSVVLLHGYGDSAATWRALLDEFAAVGQPALAVDLPGFGEAGPRSPGPFQPQFDSFVECSRSTVPRWWSATHSARRLRCVLLPATPSE